MGNRGLDLNPATVKDPTCNSCCDRARQRLGMITADDSDPRALNRTGNFTPLSDARAIRVTAST
jgi:hypothetical protein